MKNRIFFQFAYKAKGICRGDRKMELSLAFEGRISQAIFQRKSLSLAFSLRFHRSFQHLASKGEE
jgi:hypothetical protein